MLRNRPPRDSQYSQSCRRWHWWQRGLLLQALTEAEALTLQQQDVTAMHQPVEERRGHAFIAKHLRPVGKVEIRGQCDADALVAIGEKLQEQLGRRLGEGQVAQLVDQDERVAAILREELRQAQLLL